MRKFSKISVLLHTTNNIRFIPEHDRCHPRPVPFFFRKFSVSSSDCSTHFHASPHWALISEGIGISLPGNSDSLAVLSIFMAAVVVENVTTVVITFLRISPLFLPHTQKQDTGKTDIPFLMIFFISCKGSSSYLAWIYPFAFRVSAQRTAPPAAPLTVLWESPMNL